MGQAESVEQSQSWPLPQQVMPKAEQLCVHDCVQLHGSAGRVCGSVGDVDASAADRVSRDARPCCR